jgi:DNA-binding MarR family transcriptional regulator
LIKLTDADCAMSEQLGAVLMEGNREFLARLDPEEGRQLRRLLRKLRP